MLPALIGWILALLFGPAPLDGLRPPQAVNAAPVEQGSTTYTIMDLGSLGGAYAQAKGISEQGYVVGESNLYICTSGCPIHATLFNPLSGPPRDLGTLGGTNSTAKAMQGAIIVGDSDTTAGKTHGFVDTNAMYDIGALCSAPANCTSNANSINDAGVVVGTSDTDTCKTKRPSPATRGRPVSAARARCKGSAGRRTAVPSRWGMPSTTRAR